MLVGHDEAYDDYDENYNDDYDYDGNYNDHHMIDCLLFSALQTCKRLCHVVHL